MKVPLLQVVAALTLAPEVKQAKMGRGGGWPRLVVADAFQRIATRRAEAGVACARHPQQKPLALILVALVVA